MMICNERQRFGNAAKKVERRWFLRVMVGRVGDNEDESVECNAPVGGKKQLGPAI